VAYLLPARVLPGVHGTLPAQSGRAGERRQFDGVSGEYFDELRPIRSSADSYDRGKTLDLWNQRTTVPQVS
jgi:hypothetical protein